MKEQPPSRAEALQLMSENPNLVRRPILVERGQIATGFDEEKFKALTRGRGGG